MPKFTRIFISFAAFAFLTISGCSTQPVHQPESSSAAQPTISLSKLVASFMVPAGSFPAWSMGATSSTPQINWQSMGVEAGSCGSYASCRRGTARVTVLGKELQNLRQRLEPIEWDIFMASYAQAKFGPQEVEITPHCDTVSCEFNFAQAMVGSDITVTKLCQFQSPGLHRTVYRLIRGRLEADAVVDTNFGSGGASNDLTLYYSNSPRITVLCLQSED